MASYSWVLGSEGKSSPICCLYSALNCSASSLRSAAVELDVELDALLCLHLVDELLEVLLADFHNDVGEHLDEAAIGVVNETLEVGVGVARDHGGDDVVVETEVQDGVHHAGHGSARAGTDGDEQGVLQIAELLAVHLFHLARRIP